MKALGDLFMLSPRRLYDQAIEAYQKALALRPHYAEAQVGLGDAKAAKGDNEGAIANFQKALTLDPLNAQVHFSLAKIYYGEKGLYYEAVTAYKKAIELDPLLPRRPVGPGGDLRGEGALQGRDRRVQAGRRVRPQAHRGPLQPRAGLRRRWTSRKAVLQWERYIELASQVATRRSGSTSRGSTCAS